MAGDRGPSSHARLIGKKLNSITNPSLFHDQKSPIKSASINDHRKINEYQKSKSSNRIKSENTQFQHQQSALIKKINKFYVEFHRKFTLAFACIIMMIIGAPIGAIIKKGGFGLPVIFSILLFITYHVISITGEKMVKKDVLSPLIGMWSSSFIMMFIGFFLLVLINKNVNIKRL